MVPSRKLGMMLCGKSDASTNRTKTPCALRGDGLFASAGQIYNLMREILFPPGAGVLGIDPATIELFTTVHNASRSTRALGWDTDSVLCGNMSARTFTHTGYTGTMICADPVTRGGLLTVLLTNRVYPKADEASEERIHQARVRFSNAVLAAVA